MGLRSLGFGVAGGTWPQAGFLYKLYESLGHT